MKVLIIGLGAIGSLFASYLSAKHEVHGVGRKWFIDGIVKQGYLLLRGPGKHESRKIHLEGIYTSLSELKNRNFDLVIISTKAQDTGGVAREILDNSIKANCYALLQNGYGNEDLFLSVLKDVNLIRVLTNNGAYVEAPGVVVHAGVGDTYVGASHGSGAHECAGRVVNALSECGLPAYYVENLKPYLFRKLIVNSVINPLTAIFRVRNGAIAHSSHLRELAEKIIDEIVEIATHLGVNIDRDEAIETVLKVARATERNISSMLQDVLRGKRTEIDFINGAVVKLARELGLKAPLNECLYKLVKFIESNEFTKYSVES